MLEYIWNLIINNKSKDSSSKPAPQLISETLLEELDGCIKEVEGFQKEKEAQQKKETGTPDYSWLMNESIKQYKISPMLKLELEELCLQLEPDGAPLAIKDFRRVVTHETPLEKIPECFKAVIRRQLLIQNLKSDSKSEAKSNRVLRDANTLFARRLEVPSLREQDIEAWGPSKSNGVETRVNSAPPSSWRFLRQSKIQPLGSVANQVEIVKSRNNEETRRTKSVPTITTIV